VHERPVVLFSGGGTGGHLYPALAIADALRLARPDVDAVFVGSQRGIEGRILSDRGERHVLLPIQGIDRGRPVRSLAGLVGFARSLARTVRLFRTLRPEAVVVTGGYAGAPAGIVAGMFGVPLLIQEQNAVPGLVTRALARWAERIHVAFPEAIERLPRGRERARVTGNPVRPASQLDRAAARAELGLPREAVVLLVVGGSQGSLALNGALLEAVAAVREGRTERPAGLHVLWATEPRHHAGVTGALGDAAWVQAVPYLEDMPVALAAADLALARAGAMFTAELLNQGLPAILVPLPTAAADHQTRNAEALSAAGAAVVLPQSELGAARLWDTLDALLGSPDALPRMRAAAHALQRPDAASELAASVASMFRSAGRTG